MFVPAPPRKPVQVEELEIGKHYHYDSGMGGVWTVKYSGVVTWDTQNEFEMYVITEDKIGKHMFDFDDAYFSKAVKRVGALLPDEKVPELVSHIQKFETLDEWFAAGGRF